MVCILIENNGNDISKDTSVQVAFS